MKKVLFFVFGVFSAMFVYADNILFVNPCTIKSGVTSYSFSNVLTISLDNDVEDEFTAFQFDLFLPNGMTISTNSRYIELSQERFEFDTEEETPYATLGISNKSNGHYLITLYDMQNRPIHGKNGNIITFCYKTTADFNDTYAPILIKDAVITRVDRTDVKLDCVTSYAKVGTLSDVDITPEGILPAEVVADIPANATVDLSKTTAIYGTNNSNSLNVKYSRTVANEWNTICLPFDAQSTEAVKFYEITSVGTDALEVSAVKNLAAGTPALAKVAAGAITLSVQGTGTINTSLHNDGTMLGTFKPIKVNDEDTYYIKDNAFYSINEYFNVGAFKAYFTNVAGNAKANVLDIVEDATAINAVSADLNGIEEIYGVNGTRQQNLQNGLNIVKIGDKVMKVLVK